MSRAPQRDPDLAVERPRFSDYPFTLGVASGAPLPDSVVLWTRLAPKPVSGGDAGRDPVRVRWQVAHDERFARIVRRGSATARPSSAFSVHVEVDGLDPARWYFYRFIADGEESPVGRTRTAPAAGDSPAGLRFGLGSCQHFEHGFFGAHRHLAAEDLDLMVFVGDYIYEGAGRPGDVRRHVGGETRTLADYRNRHAQYKTTEYLQRLHAAVPWLLTWDDHEVDNNYAGTRDEALDPNFRERRAAAYQAYFEHMPLRKQARPTRSGVVLRARHDFGRLARFHMLDGRQRRTPQACPRRGRGGARIIDERCRELRAPDRTMLGAMQERWLARGMATTAERWNFLAQQTLMARAGVVVGGRRRFSSDPWDGYPAARERLLDAITSNGLRSCVVLSGDAHAAFVCDLKRDFADPAAPPIATEFCATSITSRGRPQADVEAILRDNPHIHFGDSTRRGYVVFDVTAESCSVSLRAIDDPTKRRTGVSTAAAFSVEAGRPGAHRL
jgi:alkaline phosphatase D